MPFLQNFKWFFFKQTSLERTFWRAGETWSASALPTFFLSCSNHVVLCRFVRVLQVHLYTLLCKGILYEYLWWDLKLYCSPKKNLFFSHIPKKLSRQIYLSRSIKLPVGLRWNIGQPLRYHMILGHIWCQCWADD